jgi:hypothetical protein
MRQDQHPEEHYDEHPQSHRKMDFLYLAVRRTLQLLSPARLLAA